MLGLLIGNCTLYISIHLSHTMSVVTLPYLLLQDMYSVLEAMLGGSHHKEDMFSPRVWQNVLRVAKDTRHTLTGAKVIMTSGYLLYIHVPS